MFCFVTSALGCFGVGFDLFKRILAHMVAILCSAIRTSTRTRCSNSTASIRQAAPMARKRRLSCSSLQGLQRVPPLISFRAPYDWYRSYSWLPPFGRETAVFRLICLTRASIRAGRALTRHCATLQFGSLNPKPGLRFDQGARGKWFIGCSFCGSFGVSTR